MTRTVSGLDLIRKLEAASDEEGEKILEQFNRSVKDGVVSANFMLCNMERAIDYVIDCCLYWTLCRLQICTP